VSRVELTLVFVFILMLGNLRGIRESGRIFAVPTYFFITTILGLIGVGVWRALAGEIPPAESAELTVATAQPLTLFLGITLLAHAYHIVPNEQETIVSQLARGVFGGRGIPYYAVQAGTMLILVLAANTAYADFPRLASILARDRHLPRQFMNQGDRLAFSNGIVGLSVLAAILLVVFGGDTHALIPLYMIGVFLSFTISQAGMVVHWRRTGETAWRAHAAMNAIGALVTGVVLIVVGITKATEGAWIIMLLIPIHVVFFKKTRQHYDAVAKQLTLRNFAPDAKRRHNIVMVPISGIQRAVVEAVNYARSLSNDVRALYVDVDPVATEQLKCEWGKWGDGVPLVVLQSPYRSLMEPLLEYIERVERESPDDCVTVVLPEFVPARWWHHLFHNQRALLIKGALLFRPRTVVTSVPFHLQPLTSGGDLESLQVDPLQGRSVFDWRDPGDDRCPRAQTPPADPDGDRRRLRRHRHQPPVRHARVFLRLALGAGDTRQRPRRAVADHLLAAAGHLGQIHCHRHASG
jgi:hypothetical protein